MDTNERILTEQETDELLQYMFKRQETLDEIRDAVIKTLKRDARKAVFRRWLRIAAFCLGLPMIVMFCLYGTSLIIAQADGTLLVGALISGITSIALLLKYAGEFSLEEKTEMTL